MTFLNSIRYLIVNFEKKLLLSWLFPVFRLQLAATPSTCRDEWGVHKKRNRKLRTFHCLACAWLTARLRITQKVWDSTLLVAFIIVNMTVKHNYLLSTRNNVCKKLAKYVFKIQDLLNESYVCISFENSFANFRNRDA